MEKKLKIDVDNQVVMWENEVFRVGDEIRIIWNRRNNPTSRFKTIVSIKLTDTLPQRDGFWIYYSDSTGLGLLFESNESDIKSIKHAKFTQKLLWRKK